MADTSTHEHSDGYSTRAIHVGSEPDPVTGALAPNLTVSTTFRFKGLDETTGYEYGRSGNPTRTELESLLTSLETCPFSHTSDCSHKDISGGDAVVFASGSACTSAICHWAALATHEGGAGGTDGNGHGGGHILAVNDVYGGTARMLSRTVKPLGVETTFLNFEQAGEEGIRKALRPDTKIVWLECPTNPLLLVPPIPLIVKIIDSLPHRPLLLVDTTFLSSFYFNPLVPVNPDAQPLADVVLSSLTKYSGGHTDIIMGALIASERGIQRHPNIIRGLRFLQNSLGGTASPRDCHLMIRSIKTLSVRMIRHGLNALRLAAWLDSRDDVEQVRYPGLKTDSAFHMVEQLISENAKRELRFLGWSFPFQPGETVFDPNSLDAVRTLGIPFGGVINFKLKDANAEQTARFVNALRLNVLAVSLGGVESLLEVPGSMTHAELPEEVKLELGITPNLVRVSVGLEDVEDLMIDLHDALVAMRI